MTNYTNLSKAEAMIIIGEAIRKERKALGLTQQKFAENADMSVSYLSEIENGHKALSTIMLFKICNGNDFSADRILRGLGPTKSTYDIVVDKSPELKVRDIDLITNYLMGLRPIKVEQEKQN